MSESYTTDEAIKYLESAKSVLAFYPDEFMCNAIISRLRAADALCQEARELAWIATIYPHIDLSKISKAIADYEEAT